MLIMGFMALALSPLYAAITPVSKVGSTGTLWQLIISGGLNMIFMGIMSVVATALIIYHFQNVRAEKLVPRDTASNLLGLLKKKEFGKATSVCKQQSNIVSAIVLKGLEKVSESKEAAKEAMETEGKMQIEKLWRNLTYLSDIAMIAPMMGLLGTIIGMIDAFHYFKPEAINPGILTQGLAKAMINTAAGLIITVPALIVYSYFRGQVSMITSTAEAFLSDIEQAMSSK